MESIFLCHLAHTSQVVSSEFVPYAIGCIKSHYLANAAHPADVRLFVYPEKFATAYHDQRPSLVGFSNFMWNLDLGYSMAEAVKRTSPETLIVFGGPNFPLETPRQEAWMRRHPAVDVYIAGEGEEPFLEVAELWRQCHSVDEVRRAEIYGTFALVDGRFRKTINLRPDGLDDAPRITDLNATPSPYLNGYLDEFLDDPVLVPIMECNRGCPFSCTFCADGIGARTKINKAALSRLTEEIHYIARRYRGASLMLADANFGMYPDDVEFSKVLAEAMRQYGYPKNIVASTGKNRKERILECAEILGGALRINAAVQSLDKQVLVNIKRNNISYDTLVSMSQRASGTESNTFSEVILALPMDSKAKHFDTVCKLVDTGLNQIRIFTLMVIDGAELGTDKERNTWNLKTRFRVIPRSFGAYRFGNETLKSVEIEEVCVENDTLSFNDYVECRRFAFTVALFYNDRSFIEIAGLLRHAGWSVSEWLVFVNDNLPADCTRLHGVYSDFVAETITELWESAEMLENHIKKDEGALESYIRGEAGNTVLLTNQARAYQECVEELNQAAFTCLRQFIARKGAGRVHIDEHFLHQLERYSLAKKKDLLDVDSVTEEQLDYDFDALESSDFAGIPTERAPALYRFAYLPWQKELLRDQMQRFGTTPQGWCKILSRTPIKKMHRRPVRAAIGETAPTPAAPLPCAGGADEPAPQF